MKELGSQEDVANMDTYFVAIELSERHLEQCHNIIRVAMVAKWGS